ncbi:MAG: methylenetetrahydrofolate reductase [Pseudonocardia sp.]
MSTFESDVERPVTDRRRSLLRDPRWELAPVKDPWAALAEVPDRAAVTMGCFALTEGFAITLDLCRELVRRGHRVTPHLPARSLDGHPHLDRVLSAYRECGISDVFVVAGNAGTPAGPFDGAIDILAAVGEAGFTTGVAAYPESHPFLAEEDAFALLRRKQESGASYLVTQTCFDADVLRDWLTRLRAAGVDLPVHLGVAGVVNRAELMRLARWMGIGASMRFISKQRKLAAKLATPGAYDPSGLLDDLAEQVTDPALGVAGLHLNTFNQVRATREWVEHMRTAAAA